MKKERVVLFPGSENKTKETVRNREIDLKEIWPGKIFKIGCPSGRYFEYIHPVLEPGNMSIREFDDFKNIEGTVIIIACILSMSNGNKIAILKNIDPKPIKGDFERIFANIEMSISSGELIAADV